MKAIVITKYGSPDVLQFEEVEKPTPKDNQVLVKVQAASANPLDWHGIRGKPFIARLMGTGLLRPKSSKVGADVAGRVEAVGKDVTQFKPGDEVFGGCNGSFAEYACAREDRVALKPANLSFEEVAAVPVAAYTALQGLRDKGHIQPGQKVLVNGASGGVGTFAVQIAKSFGAEVTGVCSTRNLDMLRKIGADHVIDYTQEDFTKNGQRYDLILDAVGNHSVSDYKRALNPEGVCVVVGFSGMSYMIQHMIVGSFASKTGSKKISMMLTKPNKEDLIFMKQLLEDGKVVPVIDRRYPLSEVPEAIRYLEAGHAQGKVIITVEHSDKT
ncbi:alcohol dehydrogenase [archaeon 13_1_20CM_2_51_12]|nr:MAG: alcohol dehydrogenase [archaeon 13_1_20CM_2_51_12]